MCKEMFPDCTRSKELDILLSWWIITVGKGTGAWHPVTLVDYYSWKGNRSLEKRAIAFSKYVSSGVTIYRQSTKQSINHKVKLQIQSTWKNSIPFWAETNRPGSFSRGPSRWTFFISMNSTVSCVSLFIVHL